MGESKLKWYIVRVQGGKEKKVQEYILNEIRRAGKEDFVNQVLIPTEKVIQVKNGKRVTVEKICFSQYVFIEANLTAEVEHLIRDIPFVAGFLSSNPKDKKPFPLPDAEINQILGKVDEWLEKDEENATSFVVGEPVQVIDGPFNGFSGNIEEVLEDKKKLKVMVKIFGRPTTLELNFVQVVKE